MRGFVAILLILIYLSVIIAQGDVDIPVSSGGARVSSGGGGSRSPDIENFIRQVESWKNNYPDRFEYLKKLLYKEPFTTTEYKRPGIWVYYTSNKTNISRSDKVKVSAVVENNNPIEIRRVLYLTIEAMEPGEKSFKPLTGTQIMQVNEYDMHNISFPRGFPELKSFVFLKKMGGIRLRVRAIDGQYDWSSSEQKNADDPANGYYYELPLKIRNNPPEINNTSLIVDPSLARWDDYIEYRATLVDKDQDTVNVTLHVFKGDKIINVTKPFPASSRGSQIVFSTKDANLFNESDAGKNFTYSFSSDDGINTTWTNISQGPRLRPNPKIKVTEFKSACEDDNYYWWQSYNFSLKAKSIGTEPAVLTVDLYTDTPAHPGKKVASKTATVPTEDFLNIPFDDIRPFDVGDCNQTFNYYFKYSAPDQDGKTQSGILQGQRSIGAKLIRNDTAIPLGIASIILILLACLLIGTIVERRFYR